MRITIVCAGAVAGLLCGKLLLAHVCDIHPRTPEEWIMEEEAKKERENKNADKVMIDPRNTEEERREALYILVKNGKII